MCRESWRIFCARCDEIFWHCVHRPRRSGHFQNFGGWLGMRRCVLRFDVGDFHRLRRGLVRGRRDNRGRQRFDFQARDAAMVHFHYGEAIAIGFKTFAATGNKSEAGEDESADRFVGGIFGKDDVVARGQFADFDGGVEDHAAVGKSERALDDVEFIVNFADHLLEDIFESGEAEDAAEFVHDHGEAGAAGAEFQEEFADGLGFGDDERVAENGAQIEFGERLVIFSAAGAIEEDPDHVFYVDEAEDVIERAFVHGDARALGGGEHGHGVFESGGGGEGVDVGARDHDFAGLDLAEFHRGLNELYFGGGEQAAVAGLLDHHLQFFGGAHQGVAVR